MFDVLRIFVSAGTRNSEIDKVFRTEVLGIGPDVDVVKKVLNFQGVIEVLKKLTLGDF